MKLKIAGWLQRAALLSLLASGAPAACAPDDGSLQLVDAATSSPLASMDADVFLDDGIRCVTDPCPTDSHTWVGRTDANGRLTLPVANPDWRLYVNVGGYRSVMLEKRAGTVLLERLAPGEGPKTPPAGSKSGNLQLVEAKVGHALLGVTLLNRGNEPLVFVRPRADRFLRYADWGGWRIGVSEGALRFQPYPMPGPYVAAGAEDLLTLEPGAIHWEAIELGDWLVWPEAAGNRLRDKERTVTVTLEWLGIPQHLQAEHAAPPAQAGVDVRVTPAVY